MTGGGGRRRQEEEEAGGGGRRSEKMERLWVGLLVAAEQVTAGRATILRFGYHLLAADVGRLTSALHLLRLVSLHGSGPVPEVISL